MAVYAAYPAHHVEVPGRGRSRALPYGTRTGGSAR